MSAFLLKKHLAWLPVIVLITVMSFSLAGKAESDAEKELGQPAGTPGLKQNEDPEKPLGTRALHLADHPKSDTEKELGQPADTAGHKQNEEAKKPLGTRGHR